MRARLVGMICIAWAWGFALQAQAEPSPLVEVMVVGGFHMSNPGRDLHDVQVDDVLAPKRQREIGRVNAALARFKPTKVAVEWPKAVVAERYPKYLAGTLPPSRNEVVQLGFNLAKTARAQGVFGIDVDGEFPYDKVQAFAAAHGQGEVLDAVNAASEARVHRLSNILATKGISAARRYLNDPNSVKADNSFYGDMLRMGAGDDQPGAELNTAWAHRNYLICANLIQLAKPGDRIVVFFGSGHGFFLRQCVAETPGMKLVAANAFLPR